MPSIFNPYVLLALVIGALGLFGSGVSIGYKWSERKHVAAVAAAQDKAIADANTAVALAIERTLAEAKKEATARAKAREARYKGELDAIKKSRPECARDAESVGLLNDAIRSANGEEATPAKLPDTVRSDPAADGWFGAFRSKLGAGSGGGIRPVSPPAR